MFLFDIHNLSLKKMCFGWVITDRNVIILRSVGARDHCHWHVSPQVKNYSESIILIWRKILLSDWSNIKYLGLFLQKLDSTNISQKIYECRLQKFINVKAHNILRIPRFQKSSFICFAGQPDSSLAFSVLEF